MPPSSGTPEIRLISITMSNVASFTAGYSSRIPSTRHAAYLPPLAEIVMV